ncbi:Phox homologous domain-containing protein [Dendryphion nanum]|uniref:Phox homologous domain-containing protein n=1 Tax=Dendryphion nanum TaxID=256645 RepID=A0A9P9EE85_9PLEO|nr:Phox homologous domain-containing protein [Dendryphion nanum]
MAPLRITIPTTHTGYEHPPDSKPFTEYEIRIAHPFPRTTTTVRKRYSDFAALDSALRSQVGSAPPVSLPPKSWLGGSLGKLGFGNTAGSPELVAKRREGLEQYLTAIETSEDGHWRISKPYREFLDLGDRDDKKIASFPGSQFGKDRVRDSSDWLEKFQDLKSNLQDARLWLTRREQATAATAQHEAGLNAKKGLVRAGALISALNEGLERLSGKGGEEWGGDKLGDGEVRRRRDMISAARKEKDGLESVLNTMAVKAAVSGSGSSTPSTSSAAVTNEQKAGLFRGANTAPSSRRVLGAPAKETERTRELDNEGVLQLQKQIMQEQDEDLVDLTQVVRRMKEMGVQINEELVEQNAMLGLLGEDVDRVDGKVRVAKKRIERIR